MAEYVAFIRGTFIEIDKVGGGTLGRAYEGQWAYVARDTHGFYAAGVDLYTGTAKTHAQAAQLVADFLRPEE